MTATEHVQRVWYEAHDAVRAYLQPFCSIDLGRKLASQACGVWVRAAADGTEASPCAYAMLFDAAWNLLTHHESMPTLGLVNPEEAEPRLDNTRLAYDMSKLYVDVWTAGQLLGWEKKLINRASKYVSMTWPVNDHRYTSLDADGVGPLAEPLARRAVSTLSEHTCLDCEICDSAAKRWEDGDRRTEQWLTDRRLRRKD